MESGEGRHGGGDWGEGAGSVGGRRCGCIEEEGKTPLTAGTDKSVAVLVCERGVASGESGPFQPASVGSRRLSEPAGQVWADSSAPAEAVSVAGWPC